MTNKTAKSGRTKVRKACESCRKRKIKCTGLQPCASCEAYNCPCIYSNKNSPATTTSSNTSNSNHNDDNLYMTTDRKQSNGIKKRQISNNITTSTSSLSSMGSLNLPSPENSKLKMTKNKGKSRDDDSDFNKIGVYENDVNIETQLSELNKIVNNLQNVTKLLQERNKDNTSSNGTSHDNIQQLLNTANDQLSSLNKNWDPTVDPQKFKLVEKYNHNNKTKSVNEKISLETCLLKNKYNDQINITKYSIWNENKYELPKSIDGANSKDDRNNSNSSNVLVATNKTGLIDDMFGLYSLFESFSFTAIGQNCKRIIQSSKNNHNYTKDVKEGIYLTLRFFDMCVSHFHENAVSVANPLESYLQMRNIKLFGQDPSSVDSQLFDGTSPANNKCNNSAHTPGTPSSSMSSTNTKALVNLLIKMLPQPFVESHTGISNQNLLDTIYDDFAMFKKLLNMYQTHERTFENFITIITNFDNQQKYNSNDINILLQLLDEEQLILALTYSYYNSTLYDYFNPETCLLYLEMLLSLLKNQIWSKDKHAFDKTIAIALQRAIQMGLLRWEFYVGLDEVIAEKKRMIWWNLYIYEKARCVKHGQPSLINDAIMSCLLPKCFRVVGFLDNSDFLKRVTEVNRNENFDSMDIQSLIFYGKLAGAQIISDYQTKVLFNERFTSVKLAGFPPLLKTQRYKEILELVEITKKRKVAVRAQLYKLFEIASDPTTSYEKHPKTDVIDAMKFILSYEHYWSYILSTLQNLEARFNTRESPSKQDIVDSTKLIIESWRRMSKIMLSFDNAYSFSKDFFFYCSIHAFILPNMHEPNNIQFDDIVENLKVFEKLSVFPILVDNAKYKQVENSHFFKEYCRNLSMTALCSRVLIGKYMHLNSLTPSELFGSLSKISPNISQIAMTVLDSKSVAYRYLLKPVAKSGFHLKVSNLLSTLGFDENNKNGPSNINLQFKPIGGTGELPNSSSRNDGMKFQSQNFMKFNTTPRNSINAYSINPPNSDINKVLPEVSNFSNGTPITFNTKEQTNNNKFENNGVNNTSRQISNTTITSNGGNAPINNNTNGFMSNQSNSGQNILLNDELMQTVGFNLGTLDEFVKHSDLNDLYNVLWSDLCPSDVQLE